MVFIREETGISTVAFAYITIIIANLAFVNITVIPALKEGGSLGTYIMLAVYETIIVLVFWSHLKTMLTEPGYVPMGYSHYKKSRLPDKY